MLIRHAILIDGGFVKHKLKAPVDYVAIDDFIQRINTHDALRASRLYRIYFYDAKPLSGHGVSPLGGESVAFGTTPIAERSKALHVALGKQPYVAMRYGELSHDGWRIKPYILREAKDSRKGALTIQAEDLQPEIRQKGVDMRIGLDIASLTLKRLVHVIVLVTGDSDFIPAMKFARREGAQLFLVTFGHGVKGGMIEHADLVLDISDADRRCDVAV